MNDPYGSRWRKWDLHIHTPASIFQEYGGDTEVAWDRFIMALEALPKDIKVIGINDYIFIDGYKKILTLKMSGRLQNIDLILPVIELRLDKFGGTTGDLSRVNYHIIFSNEIDPEVIQQHFLNALPRHYTLSPAYETLRTEWKALSTYESLAELGDRIIQSVPSEKRHQYSTPLVEGFNNICFGLEKLQEVLDIHYFKNQYLTAVGKTEWANIPWNDHSIAEKKTIINSAHFVFTSAQNATDCIRAQRHLASSAVNSRLLDCSDSHRYGDANHKDRLGKSFTWIKADTTFQGLVHAYHEYDERVFLGEKPTKVREVESNKTKYIRSVSIQKKLDSDLDENWFDNTFIELNHDLIAIIGNKGSGKSALSDILGLLGNTRNAERFSFLSPQRFRTANNNKARHFHAELIWESGLPTKRALHEETDQDLIETVKYIPQGLFEEICNEIVSEADTNFDRELRKVIFSHVENADRLGKETLDELLSYQTEETYAAIDILKVQLSEVNQEIAHLEERLSDEHRRQLQDMLDSKARELDAHESTKPQELHRPQDILEQKTRDTLARVDTLNTQLNSLQAKLADKENLQEASALLVSVAEKIQEQIKNFKHQFDDFKNNCSPQLALLGLQFEEVVNLAIKLDPVIEKRNYHEDNRKQADREVDPVLPESLPNQIESINGEIASLQEELDAPNREYQSYQLSLKDWELRRSEIVGDADALDSLEYYQCQINGLKELPQKLQTAIGKRLSIVKDIYMRIKRLAETHSNLYKPVQQFIDSHDLVREELKLNFDVSIVNTNLHERLFDWIGRNVAGSFYGPGGEKVLTELLGRHKFTDEVSIMAFLEDLMDHLTHNKKATGTPPVRVVDQLKKGRAVTALYDYIFSLDYLRPRYVLKLGDKELHQLSPGERGALLLIFYLLIDKENVPLVIDQPEENLDNETVFRLLVKCIKETKNRRQLLIVTHNPNLAVVCDAEQVICCSIDKKNGNRIEYTSGAIENPHINKKIVDILEGTKPAFDNRSAKYQPVSDFQAD